MASTSPPRTRSSRARPRRPTLRLRVRATRASGVRPRATLRLVRPCPRSPPPTSGFRKADLLPPCAAEEANKTFDSLLRSELFGPSSLDPTPLLRSPSSVRTQTQYTATTSPSNSPASAKPLFSFHSPSRKRITREGAERGLDSPTHERYSLSPVRHESQKLLLSPRKAMRQVSRVPFKVRRSSSLTLFSALVSLLTPALHRFSMRPSSPCVPLLLLSLPASPRLTPRPPAGRLLPQPRRLVVDERARRRARFVRLHLERPDERG